MERVSQRVAKGIPLELALAGESVTEEDYKEHLEQNPKLAAIEGAAKCRFLEEAIGGLLRGDNASANIRWLLERVYPDLFTRSREDEVEAAEEKRLPTIVGMTEEEIEEMQAAARLL